MNSNSSLPNIFTLDNASQIFVNIMSHGETTLSRIGLNLNEDVDRERLQQAINHAVTRRFPYFQVYLKKTILCYVLERTYDLPGIEEDGQYCVRYINFHKKKFLFRFLTNGRNIALEMSHIITDAYGLMVFLLTVVAEYFRMDGVEIAKHPLVFDLDSEIVPSEWGCGYSEVFDKRGPVPSVDTQAYIPSGKPVSSYAIYYTTRFRMDAEVIKQMAKQRSTTPVAVVGAIYYSAIQALYLEDVASKKARWNKSLRLQIPLNLRSIYKTRSMKNFCYVYSPSYTIGSKEEAKSCEELIQFITDRIRYEKQNQIVEKQIKRNLRASRSFMFIHIPRILKEVLFASFYQLFARGIFSGVITNIGKIDLPLGIRERVESLDIVACNSPAPGRNTSMFTYKGVLEICVGSTIEDSRLEDKLCEQFNLMGIKHSIISNKEDAKEP